MLKSRLFPLTIAVAVLVATGVLFQNCAPGFDLADPSSSSSSDSSLADFSQEIILSQDAAIANLTFPCAEPEYKNFNCVDKVLRTSEGRDYSVRFRWNRISSALGSNGTVIWVLGGDGRRQWRVIEPPTTATQDDFDSRLGIRSVEIEFLDDPKVPEGGAGYWVHGGGYYSASLAYFEAVKYVAANLKVGAFMNHVGGSNGTMVAAYALSHFGVGTLVDRFVLHAGPFLASFEDACNPTHFASFSLSTNMFATIKGLMGTWSYLDPKRETCGAGDLIFRNSVLSGPTMSVYPRNGLHVVMGAKEATEGFGPWILESNHQWYSLVQAAEKTRRVFPNLGHQMEWDSVRTYAPLPKPGAMGIAPTLVFSTAENGAAATQFSMDTRIYGALRNIDAASAMSCMQLESEFSKCENPANWTPLPNGDWVYTGGVWRYAFVPSQAGYAPGVYKGFSINAKTGQRTATVRIELIASARPVPTVTFSNTLNGASASRFGLNSTVYGVARNFPAVGTMACMQEASQFSLCNDPKNWTPLPNAEWSYVNGEWRTQFTPARIGAVAGKTYLGFHVDTTTGARSATASLAVDP